MPPPDAWSSGPRQKAATRQTNDPSLTGPFTVWVVVSILPNGRPRRRVYCTARPALRALARARSAGRQASVLRARLTPVVIG